LRRAIGSTVACVCLALAAGLATPAGAAAGFETGLQAPEYTSDDETLRDTWFDETVDVGARLVRLDVSWRSVARAQPLDPSNPFDPAYDFARLDTAVREASERGLEAMFTIVLAPAWAEGAGRPSSATEGTWRPDPAAFASFGEAIAMRYSGNAGLPRVRYYQAWNEPNLSDYLTPQWQGRSPAAPAHYRQMLNAFYAAVKGVDASNVVITGGNAPYGDPAGGDRMRPLRFDRELLCLRDNLKPAGGCERTDFDVFAHHPINTSGGPNNSAIAPDDATTPDFKNVGRIVRAAERAGTAGGAGRHQLWATELWWETKPPDRKFGVGLTRQARFVQEALYVLWKQGAKKVFYFLIRDRPFDPGNPARELQSGLFFENGAPKPSARAFAFPFVTERVSNRKLRAWGKAPSDGKLRIQQQRGKGWRTVGAVRVRAGKVFTKKLAFRGKARYRAKIGGTKSLTWRQGGLK
jgi:hypothetical protein